MSSKLRQARLAAQHNNLSTYRKPVPSSSAGSVSSIDKYPVLLHTKAERKATSASSPTHLVTPSSSSGGGGAASSSSSAAGAKKQPDWEDFDEGVFSRRRTQSFDGISSRSVVSDSGYMNHHHMNITRNTTPVSTTSAKRSTFSSSSLRGVRSVDEEEEIGDDDMPVDEFVAAPTPTSSKFDSSSPMHRMRSRRPPLAAVDAADRGGGMPNAHDDDVSSLGGVEDRTHHHPHQAFNLARFVANLKQQQTTTTPQRPPSFASNDERYLWDTIQGLLQDKASTQSSPDTSALKATLQRNEETLQQNQGLLKLQQNEHAAEIRAMQRVLADVTSEREKEVNALKEEVQSLKLKLDPNSGSVESQASKEYERLREKASKVDDLVKQVQDLKKQLLDQKAVPATSPERKGIDDNKSRRIVMLERDLKSTKTLLKQAQEENLALSKAGPHPELEALRKELLAANKSCKKAQGELEIKEKQLKEKQKYLESKERQLKQIRRSSNRSLDPNAPPRSLSSDSGSVHSHSTDNDSVASEEVEILQQSLTETTNSLDNAKKIIASLENAQGSLAQDLRAKLKAKEDELALVQQESDERKRTLDTLATELRDLQRSQGNTDRAEQISKQQVIHHKALVSQLEKSISGLQSAAVVHEVSLSTGMADETNIDNVSHILEQTMNALKHTVEASENFIEDYDDDSAVVVGEPNDPSVESAVGKHIDTLLRNDREAMAKDMRLELDQKKIAIMRLEEALKKQNEELRRAKSELATLSTDEQMREEIESLRLQCSTNMEMLARKDRELSVLRASLNVDDNDVGYISDDASDVDELAPEVTASIAPAAVGDVVAPAPPTTTNGTSDASDRTEEIVSLKKELNSLKDNYEKADNELKVERESLASAKMIISSLEQANKNMMEDLRSRLQDSNTAISSLLDKSMEHEKLSMKLQEDLEKVSKERDEQIAKYQAEVKRLGGNPISIEEKKEEDTPDP